MFLEFNVLSIFHFFYYAFSEDSVLVVLNLVRSRQSFCQEKKWL